MERYIRLVSPFVVMAVFVAALWLLHQEMKDYHLRDVIQSLEEIPARHLILAVFLTVLNYTVLIGYDLIATRHIGRRLPLPQLALASFLGYVSANNFGSLLGSTTVRYRLYSSWGLSTVEIVKLIAMLTVSFWIGLAAFGGVVLIVEPLLIPGRVHLPFATSRPLGCLLLAGVVAYLVLGAVRKRPIGFRGWEVTLLPTRVSFAQISVASADFAVLAGVLFVLLPDTVSTNYIQFLGIFLLALIAAVFSNVPGGLGVFELTILVLLNPSNPHGVLGALLAYRTIYYLIPLAVAGGLLGGHELILRRSQLRQLAAAVSKVAPAVAPVFFAMLTFVAGTLLLFSGAMPTEHERLGWIHHVLPLPVLEISHFLGSVIGAALLLLARGLQRRLDTAYWLTMAMLCAGAIFSVLKGLDYEEAAILLAMMLLLAPARPQFYRHGSLMQQDSTLNWLIAAFAVIACSVWVGLFSYRHVDYSHELWWQFSFRGDAPRFLRATAGVVVFLLALAVIRLLRPARPRPAKPAQDELAAAAAVVARSPATYAHLVLLGDKYLLFNDDRSAFIMYGVTGRSWIAMGDPIGPAPARRTLLWGFRELSDCYDGRTVFYQVGEDALSLYLDIGLTLVKLGEEARVPLCDFSLEGSARKQLRQTANRVQREGCSFEILTTSKVRARMDELQAVSDAWLAQKSTAEKGFSLGSFQPDYIALGPVAIIHLQGKMLAFANLWLGAEKEELSVDLMRHTADAPPGVMEHLFTELMLWGRAEGYRWFNLGMAPLSGLDGHSWAPLWSRLGGLVFRHGEHFYNFQGLRQYKEKFHPQWRPRYLATPGGLSLPQILTDVAALISGGPRKLFMK